MKTPNRHLVSPRELRQVMSHLMNNGDYFMAGASSVFVPKGGVKYVDKTVCKIWDTEAGGTSMITPGEAARYELRSQWPHLKRVGWRPGMYKLLGARPPIFFGGRASGKMVYVDLVGAYSQIYEKLWLDTAYPRGYYGRFPLSDVAKRLRPWKAARNTLIGICRSTSATAYRGHKRLTVKTKNKYLAPGLWATIQDTLHMVATKALDLGAIYINTDGYIFPLGEWSFVEEFLFWLGGLGFRWSIRAEGVGEILAWNNYSIGQVRTQANKLNLRTNVKEFSNVQNHHTVRQETYWRNICSIHSGGDVDQPPDR